MNGQADARHRMGRKGLRMVVLLAGLVACAGWMSACNSHTELPLDPQEAIRTGQPLYEQHCAECHQADGMGSPTEYPRLAGNPIVTLHDPSPAIHTVTYGQGAMPGFRQTLDSVEIAAVLSYIRNAWGNKATAVSPKQIP